MTVKELIDKHRRQPCGFVNKLDQDKEVVCIQYPKELYDREHTVVNNVVIAYSKFRNEVIFVD